VCFLEGVLDLLDLLTLCTPLTMCSVLVRSGVVKAGISAGGIFFRNGCQPLGRYKRMLYCWCHHWCSVVNVVWDIGAFCLVYRRRTRGVTQSILGTVWLPEDVPV
jgi:hypothetical protein